MPENTSNTGITLQDYKGFFDETPVALVRTDVKTGEFLMANKYAANLLGFETVEDLKSKIRTTDLYPIEERKKLIKTLRKQGRVAGHEIQLTLPQKTLWVSATFQLSNDGAYIEGSLIDITELVTIRNSHLTMMREVGAKIDKKIAALACA